MKRETSNWNLGKDIESTQEGLMGNHKGEE